MSDFMSRVQKTNEGSEKQKCFPFTYVSIIHYAEVHKKLIYIQFLLIYLVLLYYFL